MLKYYILLGSNVGDKINHLTNAVQGIKDDVGFVTQISSLYITEPWGLKDQSDFYNIVLEVHSTLEAEEMLRAIKKVELNIGRQKEVHWGPRSIDIDILYCDDKVIQTAELTIPHPQIYNRNFVLIPLMEIAGEYVDPAKNLTIEELYDVCDDACEVMIADEKLPIGV